MFIHARISSNIYCVTDMTNDLKNRQILHSDTEFTEWQYILISLQNKCLIQPQIQRFSLHLNRCLQTSSIPLLAFARFPSFPPKFFPSWHEDITPLIWLEALNNNFLFFNSIYHYFWFSPISPSHFFDLVSTIMISKDCSTSIAVSRFSNYESLRKMLEEQKMALELFDSLLWMNWFRNSDSLILLSHLSNMFTVPVSVWHFSFI